MRYDCVHQQNSGPTYNKMAGHFSQKAMCVYIEEVTTVLSRQDIIKRFKKIQLHAKKEIA